MSGIKSQDVTQLYRLLHARGLTTSLLADRIATNRAHLTQVLNGSRPALTRHGRPSSTWRRLVRVLESEAPEALLHLQQCSTWNFEEVAV